MIAFFTKVRQEGRVGRVTLIVGSLGLPPGRRSPTICYLVHFVSWFTVPTTYKYFRYRYLAPCLARFWSVDSLVFGTSAIPLQLLHNVISFFAGGII